MKRHFLAFCSVLLLALLPAAGHSQVAYNKTTGRLTVKSEGPLTRLLAEVSLKTGIEIYIAPGMDAHVSADIRNRPVEDAIKELIGTLNNVFVYQGNSSVIKTVKIYATSPADATVRIAPAGGASAASPAQKLPPSQAELEAKARRRWEQRAAARGLQETPERRKKREEREKKQEALKAEREKQTAELEEAAKKHLEESQRRFRNQGAAAPETPLPPSEPGQ